MDRRRFVKLAAASPALAALPDRGGRSSLEPTPATTPPGTDAAPDTGDPMTHHGEEQASFRFYSPLAEEWHRGGDSFDWTSTTPKNDGRKVRVFYRTFGSRSDPALVMLHGYPTSSFDFREMIPHLEEGDPVRVAYADIEAFNDGIGARLHVGKYLLERAANEYRWLDNLRVSPIPTALVWGLTDPVNPVRIADHIWLEYLNDRAVEGTYWLLPTAGHYPHRDEPEEMAGIVRTCLERGIPSPEEENAFMWELAREREGASSPVYVGRSIIENVYFPGAVEYSPEGYDY